MRVFSAFAFAFLNFSAGWAIASEAPEPVGDAVVAASSSGPVEEVTEALSLAEAQIMIPKLTPVSLEIMTLLGSKISRSGEKFQLRLVEPIVIDGREIIPAGAEGMGEVIHAKKGGGMGAAGELVLAARYLDVDGRQIKLRSMSFVSLGKDNIDTSAVIAIAIGFPALFVGGGNSQVTVGTRASAKTREDFTLEPAAQAKVEEAMIQQIDDSPKSQIESNVEMGAIR